MQNHSSSRYTQRIDPNQTEADGWLSNTLIYRLCYTHVASFYGVYTCLILFFLASTFLHHFILVSLVGVSIGLFFWSFIEYLMHRYAFHFDHPHKLAKISTFIFHGVHHAYPRKMAHSITPLFFSLPLSLAFYYLFSLIFKTYTHPVFAGFLMGYVLYTLIHDATHHFSMNFPLLKSLKKNHMAHHYFSTQRNFGVSSPLWDHIFKTYSH